jgi:hypothetical protein
MQCVEQEWFGNAFHFDRYWGRNFGYVTYALVRGGAQENLPSHRTPFDAGGEVHGGADHGVLGTLLGANVADHGLSRINANAHLETRPAAFGVLLIELSHGALHGER